MAARKVTVNMRQDAARLNFSDLDEGEFFVATNGGKQRLFYVRKSNPQNCRNRQDKYGYADCLNDPVNSYTTASDGCFPDGVRRADVEITVLD